MSIHRYRDGRVKLTGQHYTQMRRLLCDLAGSHCEVCGKYTGMASGDPDHQVLRGMGGAKRDDRIFVDGKRQLIWKCRGCHNERHVPSKVVPEKAPTPDEFKQLLGLHDGVKSQQKGTPSKGIAGGEPGRPLPV